MKFEYEDQEVQLNYLVWYILRGIPHFAGKIFDPGCYSKECGEDHEEECVSHYFINSEYTDNLFQVLGLSNPITRDELDEEIEKARLELPVNKKYKLENQRD